MKQFREPTKKELTICLAICGVMVAVLLITLATRSGSFVLSRWQNVSLLGGVVLFAALIGALVFLYRAFASKEARKRRGRENARKQEIEHWETQIILNKAFFIITVAVFAVCFIFMVLYCLSFFNELDIAGVIVLPTVFPTLTIVSALVFIYLVWRQRKMKDELQKCIDGSRSSAHKKGSKGKGSKGKSELQAKKHPAISTQENPCESTEKKHDDARNDAAKDNAGDAFDDDDVEDGSADDSEPIVGRPDPFEMIRKK